MMYEFYPCRPDGSSIAFDIVECPNDAAARIVAGKILERHDSAVEVVFWAGERRVGVVAREPV